MLPPEPIADEVAPPERVEIDDDELTPAEERAMAEMERAEREGEEWHRQRQEEEARRLPSWQRRELPTTEDLTGGRPGPDHQGGYIYGDLNRWGGTLGVGVGHERGGDADVNGPHLRGGLGIWRDRDGVEHRGIRVSGNTLSIREPVDPNNPGQPPGSLEGPSFDAGIYSDDQTLTFGLGASLFDVGAPLVDERRQNGAVPVRQDDDRNARIHGGLGPGGAVRIHHGDADGDGVRDLGFGVSLFNFGFDYRSEALGRGWNAARDWWNR